MADQVRFVRKDFAALVACQFLLLVKPLVSHQVSVGREELGTFGTAVKSPRHRHWLEWWSRNRLHVNGPVELAVPHQHGTHFWSVVVGSFWRLANWVWPIGGGARDVEVLKVHFLAGDWFLSSVEHRTFGWSVLSGYVDDILVA